MYKLIYYNREISIKKPTYFWKSDGNDNHTIIYNIIYDVFGGAESRTVWYEYYADSIPVIVFVEERSERLAVK